MVGQVDMRDISRVGIQDQLKDMVEDLKKEIESRDNLDKIVLDNAIDVTIERLLGRKEIIGFSMLLSFGGPNIEWITHRGISKLVGYWGNAVYETEISPDVANDVISVLEELDQ